LNPLFIEVRNNAEKLKVIAEAALSTWRAGQTLLILAPNAETLTYLDAFLWKEPAGRFLPHAIDQGAPILLSLTLQKADVLLNLTPEPISSPDYRLIELWDDSHPDKRLQSQKKKQFYALTEPKS